MATKSAPLSSPPIASEQDTLTGIHILALSEGDGSAHLTIGYGHNRFYRVPIGRAEHRELQSVFTEIHKIRGDVN